jgi:hypothetical protein
MADFLDNTDDVWGADAPETPEVPVEPEQTVEAQAEPVEAETAPEEEAPAEEKFNPTLYREMKEERAKRQALERELEEVRKLAAPQKPQADPFAFRVNEDAYENKEGFNQEVSQNLSMMEWNLRAGMSERWAIKEHGAEVVKEATDWGLANAQRDPTFAQRIMADPDPVGRTLSEYQQSKTLETLAGRPFEDAAKDYAISQGWIVSEPGAAQAAPILKPSPPAAPRGLASAPGKGGVGQAPQGADWGEIKFALG